MQFSVVEDRPVEVEPEFPHLGTETFHGVHPPAGTNLLFLRAGNCVSASTSGSVGRLREFTGRGAPLELKRVLG